MQKKSSLRELIDSERFTDADSLLKQHLIEAKILDPSNAKTWAPYADQISFTLKSNQGQNAFNTFWDEMLDFFENRLEPIWGHLHKGHILFRLGLGNLFNDVAKGRIYLEKALEEDRLLEMNRLQDQPNEIEKAVQNYSAYVALCIIERTENEYFESRLEKQRFFQDLFSSSFDAAIFGREISPDRVNQSIGRIIPKLAIKQTLYAKQELDIVHLNRLPIAIISLAGTVLENMLLGILYYQRKIKSVGRKDILGIELGPLINEATDQSVFPSDSIKAACKTIQIFRNRLHPGNELKQKYKLTSRVAVTLKILLDQTIVIWAAGNSRDINI